MQRLPLIGLALAVPLAAFVYINNTSLLSASHGGRPTLLAHCGLHQTFPTDGLKADTCTAARIHPPEHGFLENTIPSMQAAFEAGADVVELDVLPPTATSPYSTTGCWTVEPTARA
jgi:glycerophosphoryl diester phosphodiesterase